MIGLAPIHIQPLLEIHCCPRVVDQPHVDPQRLVDLFEMGLIEKARHRNEHKVAEGYSEYTTSEKGCVYVEALTRVPLPVQKWSVQFVESTDG